MYTYNRVYMYSWNMEQNWDDWYIFYCVGVFVSVYFF